MATVTVFSAAKSQEIEDKLIVAAEVIGGELILHRSDASDINAGVVGGGDGSSAAIEAVAADLAAFEDSVNADLIGSSELAVHVDNVGIHTPGGRELDYAEIIDLYPLDSTLADVVGLTVAPDIGDNACMIEFWCNCIGLNNSEVFCIIQICTADNTVVGKATGSSSFPSFYLPISVKCRVPAGTGVTTFKVRAVLSGGTGAIFADLAGPAFLQAVEV